MHNFPCFHLPSTKAQDQTKSLSAQDLDIPPLIRAMRTMISVEQFSWSYDGETGVDIAVLAKALRDFCPRLRGLSLTSWSSDDLISVWFHAMNSDQLSNLTQISICTSHLTVIADGTIIESVFGMFTNNFIRLKDLRLSVTNWDVLHPILELSYLPTLQRLCIVFAQSVAAPHKDFVCFIQNHGSIEALSLGFSAELPLWMPKLRKLEMRPGYIPPQIAININCLELTHAVKDLTFLSNMPQLRYLTLVGMDAVSHVARYAPHIERLSLGHGWIALGKCFDVFIEHLTNLSRLTHLCSFYVNPRESAAIKIRMAELPLLTYLRILSNIWGETDDGGEDGWLMVKRDESGKYLDCVSPPSLRNVSQKGWGGHFYSLGY
ncbi:hypothetical protein BU17DRAFT_86911 [Hysterangium stoloniferum]|nr:hypothetical protein BU17DRAFT_86911 [Hysterangium stoloniferum]